jgi:rfaE bifunctional protein kinase chain/domain
MLLLEGPGVPPAVLDEAVLERVLSRLPGLTVAVVGDLFLDRYLDCDAALTELSLETGLPAYQVVGVRSYPGAAGTVINNLVALGVGRVLPVAVIGDDGEGHELRRALQQLPAVLNGRVLVDGDRRTPTYTKPMLSEPGRPPRELSRLDIKNRTPLSAALEEAVIKHLDGAWSLADAVIVLDQVSEPDCGVITARVRQRLADLGAARPGKFVLADSRERIGLFRNVCVKPNVRECRAAVGGDEETTAARELSRRTGRPVFCTLGERGMWLAEPPWATLLPGYRVAGPVDPVGAGDSTSAGIACAVAAGAPLEQAGAFGNLVASITVQQIGTTGTASPEQVRRRWRELLAGPA